MFEWKIRTALLKLLGSNLLLTSSARDNDVSTEYTTDNAMPTNHV